MITNYEGLTSYFVRWLQAQAWASGTKNGCVGLSGGIDSAVVFALCCRAFPKTVAVLMPCHSSEESITRAQEVIASQTALGFTCVKEVVNLEAAFTSIVSQATGSTHYAAAGLRSCLRAPVLDYISKVNSSLVYGTGNRDEDEIFRYYQKRGDGAVDNNVIVGLHKSEVRGLAAHLGLPQSVIDAVPTADLWGEDSNQTDESELGLTYDEIEWVTRLNASCGILALRAEFDPDSDIYFDKNGSKHGDKYGKGEAGFRRAYASKYLTQRQLEIVEKAYQAEKVTKHKSLPPPGVSRKELVFFLV